MLPLGLGFASWAFFLGPLARAMDLPRVSHWVNIAGAIVALPTYVLLPLLLAAGTQNGDEETLAVSNHTEVPDGQEDRQGMALDAWGSNHRDRSIVHLSRRFLARWRDRGCARIAVWPVRFCPNHYLGCAHCPKNGQPLRAKDWRNDGPSPQTK